MGNQASHNRCQRKKHPHRSTQSSTKADRQNIYQRNINSHYHAIDQTLAQHFKVLNSNSEVDQAVANAHRQALTIAMRNHVHTVFRNSCNGHQTHQIIYDV
ncbi:unnamed protein product [Adineta ricciae]|uniref:Uncharacterized protein n=1 Tax=Adineta ricciae TaxID=249248 RepID=A0A813RAT9_ADIRI|nr:unnamed protein product [Adineta ricciae]CAF0805091.1 unnamed protein product [Adineta ricciae]